jgi:hypothetical protein
MPADEASRLLYELGCVKGFMAAQYINSERQMLLPDVKNFTECLRKKLIGEDMHHE